MQNLKDLNYLSIVVSYMQHKKKTKTKEITLVILSNFYTMRCR